MLPTMFATVKSLNSGGESCLYFELAVECKAEDFEIWLKEFERKTKTKYTVSEIFCFCIFSTPGFRKPLQHPLKASMQ